MSFSQISALQVFTVLLLFLSVLLESQAQDDCPSDWCFCSKSSADLVCGITLLSGKCEVGECSDGGCTSKGYRCQPKINETGPLSDEAIQQIRDLIEANGGCKGNVCFAIDGSGSIDKDEYKDQLDFVSDVIRVLSPFDTRVTGTQYSDKSYPISTFTTDLNGFVTKMKAANQVRLGTSITSGLIFCSEELKNQPFSELQPNKVVVLGDGFHNGGPKDDVEAEADKLRSDRKALVSVVGVKNADDQFLLKIADDSSLAFEADSFADANLLGGLIKNLTVAICKP